MSLLEMAKGCTILCAPFFFYSLPIVKLLIFFTRLTHDLLVMLKDRLLSLRLPDLLLLFSCSQVT